MRGKYLGAFLAASVAIAQPAAAAGDYPQSAFSDQRPAAFGGFTVRVPLGKSAAARPEARLQLTTYKMGPGRASGLRAFNRNGLELGLSKAGKPMLFSGGQNTAEVQRKMGLSTTTTLVIVGGIVLVVVILASVADAMPTAGPDEDAFD